MKRLLLILCCISVPAWADWNIAAEFRVVRVPVSAGLKIVEQFSEEQTSPDAMAALDALIRNGTAIVAAGLYGKAVDGAQLVVESVEGYRYPTNYQAPIPELVPKLSRWLAIPAFADTFHVRDVGINLQCRAIVSEDGNYITASVGLKNLRHVGELRYEYGMRPNGLKYFVEQPKFGARSTTTSVVVKNGLATLMGCHLPHEVPGQMELHVLTLNASNIGELKRPLVGGKWVFHGRLELMRYQMPASADVMARVAILQQGAEPEGVLQKLVADGKAKVSSCASVPTTGGVQFVSENILEIRYPAEEGWVSSLGAQASALAARKAALIRKWRGAQKFFAPVGSNVGPVYPPTNFDVVNTGSSLQVEFGEVDDIENPVAIEISSRAVDLSGFARRTSAERSGEWAFDYEPKFSVRKTTGSRSLPVGKWVLQSVHRRPAPQNDIEVSIVRIKTSKALIFHNSP